ncbi:glycosyltransferase [Candidatus Babeliales bacterium]|nr:glycosyltransferase [Candidatus Babeliales bacterium]
MSVDGRVVYIITKLELGGAQKVCLALHQDLKKNKMVSTLISGKEGALVQEAGKSDHVILLEDFKREVGFGLFLYELRAFWNLYKVLRSIVKKHPDIIVHTHSTKAGIMGRWAAFFARVKYRIHTVHGFGFHDYQPWHTWYMIFIFEWITSLITSHFVCVSEKDKAVGSKKLPFFARKSSIIRAAVDDEKYQMAKKSSNKWHEGTKIVIGTIACFKPQKNMIDLLRSFYKLKIDFLFQCSRCYLLKLLVMVSSGR